MSYQSWSEALESAVANVELNGSWVECGFDYAYGSIEGFKSEIGYEIDEEAEVSIEWFSEARDCFDEIEGSKNMTKLVATPDAGTTSIFVTARLVSLSAKRNGWSGYKWNAVYAVSNT